MTRRSFSRLLLALAPLLAAAPGGAALLFDTDPPRPPVSVALRRVLGGLDQPTAIANAGDGRLFLALQGGLVVIVEQGALRPEAFLDIRPLMTQSGPGAHSGEQGLLGLAVHPRYAQNGFFFVDYTDQLGAIVVARYRVSAEDPQRADPASGRILLTIPKQYVNHNGGQIQFGPDGYLYVSVGDGGGAGGPSCFSQKSDSLLGKLLRLDVDANVDTPPYHGIPASNPFPGSPIWATGLRNAWRFSFDRLTGDLWIADVGESAREEIDVQPAGTPGGRNYGWKLMEGTACFSTASCPVGSPPCGSPDLTPPVLEYGHGGGECSITGGYVSRAPSLPHVWGIYFFGDLCSGRLWAADRQGESWRVRQLPQRLPGVDTFGEDHAGNLWAATHEGELFELVPELPVDTPGLYHPAAARFLLKDLLQDGPEDRTLRWGRPRNLWVPLAGDWDGDGRTGVGLWDAGAGLFRLKNTIQQGFADLLFAIQPPSSHAVPLAGDWDGDGKDTVGFYEPTTSTFHLTNVLAGTGLPVVFQFGGGGLPVVGDWDGDGRDTVGLYVSGRGAFLLRNELSAGPPSLRVRTGTPKAGCLPLAGDWDGDGKDSVGLYDPATATFRLLDALRSGPDDRIVRFGTPGAGQVPLAGEW
ncbi:MAG TPA: PQQ-dependent sugar dehydrogenase [Thermoanaerobaculia bacterium]|nr:PQQ-dependent sugar dehydrogenase [Thermoanaerobaculia bacterium]